MSNQKTELEKEREAEVNRTSNQKTPVNDLTRDTIETSHSRGEIPRLKVKSDYPRIGAGTTRPLVDEGAGLRPFGARSRKDTGGYNSDEEKGTH